MIRMGPATLGLILLARAASAQGTLPFGTAAGGTVVRAGPLVEVIFRLEAPVRDALEVLRFEKRAGSAGWVLAEPAGRMSQGQATLDGRPGVETLLALRAPGRPGYLLDGPFRWPGSAQSRGVPLEWRRTIRGRFRSERLPLLWVDAQAERRLSPWPVCEWLTAEDWECIGIPLAASGVVLMPEAAGVAFGLAAAPSAGPNGGSVAFERAAWGRLVIVSRAERADQQPWSEIVRASGRRLAASRLRAPSTRLEIEDDPTIRIHPVDAGLFWVSGREPQSEGWVEFGATGSAGARMEVGELAPGSPQIPVPVRLEPGSSISGRVISAEGTSAADAVIALYRVVADSEGKDRPPRRIAVAETRAQPAGEFRFGDLARDRYQILAVHPVLGRGELSTEADTQDVEIRLRAPSQIVGRITRGGVPVAGAPIAVVPDVGQFAASADVTELRGGEAKSDRQGRFRVAAAFRGSSELRIGDQASGVRRIPLGPAESLPAAVDVGTIDLGDLPSATLVLEGADSCELLLTGPAGRLGLTMVRAKRAGPAVFEVSVPEPGTWHVVAICGARERAVLPATIDFEPGQSARSIRLTWPNPQSPIHNPQSCFNPQSLIVHRE